MRQRKTRRKNLASHTQHWQLAANVNEESLRDCLSCGVCCFSQLETYVRVTGDDWARLGAEAEEHAHFIGNRAYMKMREGHCSALEVRDGFGGERAYFCKVYEIRPQTCRDLGRGSPQCAGERALKAQRTLAVLV